MQSMIDKYRFNIDKIILTDNSIKKCGNKINIILSSMLMLLTGNTWQKTK
jgi:hypothetical protein